ncbi:GtrA family protein [Homoserinimonas sp. OAct 916]|uniref:GtrA family protein n=1 Tax=Homoserinimonas sp. OAct 916 TaxID=2211450 RepID=UPI001300891C|nr:GtrA family protein [Homoserinimonas sp. OAct 916]
MRSGTEADAGAEVPLPPSNGLVRLVNHSATRYLLAGGAAFLVDLGILALLKLVLLWPLWLATGTAFLVSFFFTYSIQRVFAFTSQSPHGQALVRYAILVAFNTLATILIVGWVNDSPVGWVGGKVIATAVTTVWNYFIYRYWVFASGEAGTRDQCSTQP